MLALRTNWTPEIIANLPGPFHAALHHAMWLETLIPQEGIPALPSSAGRPMDQRTEIVRAAVAQDALRKVIFPEDEDV